MRAMERVSTARYSFGEEVANSVTHGLGWLLSACGLAYTLGLVFYGWHRLPYGHAVWHLFVLAGSATHYLAVVFAVGISA